MTFDAQKFGYLMQMKEYSSALTLVQDLTLNPAKNAELMLTRAKLNMMHQRFKKALDDCKKLSKAKLAHPELALIESQAALEIEDYGIARQALQRLSKFKSHEIPYLKLSAKLQYENNRYEEAIKLSDRILEVNPRDSSFLLFKTNAQIAAGLYLDAQKSLDVLKSLDGQYGKYRIYEDSLSKLIDLDPNGKKEATKTLSLGIITPVGPGHKQLAKQCANGVRKLAESSKNSLFATVEHIIIDDTKGSLGRSKARNQAIEQAIEQELDWLFFLDADDQINAEIFNVVAPYLNEVDCLWGGIYSGKKDGPYHYRLNQLPYIEDLSEYVTNDPFLTLQMGHFVKTELLKKNHIRFNEEKDCAEDVEFYLQELSSGKGLKIPEPLFYNIRGEHSKGPRSATGSQWSKDSKRAIKTFLANNPLSKTINVDNITTSFAINNPFDLIQKAHIRGSYFEQKELEELAKYLPQNCNVLEVGANIGNHGLFYLQQCGATHVEFVEPNPTALNLLKQNLALNKIDERRFDIHPVGAGASRSSFSIDEMEDNLGASSLRQEESGTIQVLPLDELDLNDRSIGFIKIDVEGMEMEALAGASKLIETQQPLIYIEVANENKTAFGGWLENQGYEMVLEHKAVNASNYLCRK